MSSFYFSLILFTLFLGKTNGQSSWKIVETTGNFITRSDGAFSRCGSDTYCLLGGRGTPQTSIYTTSDKTWKTGPSPPLELHHFQAVEYDGCAWAFGAWNGPFPFEKNVGDVYRFCPKRNKWEKSGVKMKRDRGAGATVVVGEKVYVIGGNVGGHGAHAELKSWMDVYDFDDGEWKELDDMPNPRDHFDCVVVKDEIVCAGGRDTSVADFFNKNEENVDVYNLDSGKWRTLKSKVPTPRGGGMSGVLNGRVVFAGGEGNGKAYATVEILDVETDKWTKGPDMTSKRHGTGMVTDGNAVFVAAGSGVQGAGAFSETLETLQGSRSDDDDQNGNENGQDGSVCFPASSIVQLSSGRTKVMEDLMIGDVVRVGPQSFSEVFFFTHREAETLSTFIQIQTANATSVILTPSHYLYVNGVFTAARNVRVGDKVHVITSLLNIPTADVISVKRRVERGLYNPHTVHGDIVVNGVKTSTFTEAVEPVLAKGLLKPVEWLYVGMGMIKFGNGLFNKLNENVLRVFERTIWKY